MAFDARRRAPAPRAGTGGSGVPSDSPLRCLRTREPTPSAPTSTRARSVSPPCAHADVDALAVDAKAGERRALAHLDAEVARLRHQAGVELVAPDHAHRPPERHLAPEAPEAHLARAATAPTAPSARARARAIASSAWPVSPPPHGFSRGNFARSSTTMRPRSDGSRRTSATAVATPAGPAPATTTSYTREL